MTQQLSIDFSGKTYSPEHDCLRLNAQLQRVWQLMQDGCWRTLGEIEQATGDPQASVSARLRDMRKPHFGSHKVERRRRGEGRRGLWEYQVLVREPQRAGQ